MYPILLLESHYPGCLTCFPAPTWCHDWITSSSLGKVWKPLFYSNQLCWRRLTQQTGVGHIWKSQHIWPSCGLVYGTGPCMDHPWQPPSGRPNGYHSLWFLSRVLCVPILICWEKLKKKKKGKWPSRTTWGHPWFRKSLLYYFLVDVFIELLNKFTRINSFSLLGITVLYSWWMNYSSIRIYLFRKLHRFVHYYVTLCIFPGQTVTQQLASPEDEDLRHGILSVMDIFSIKNRSMMA